MNTLQKIINSPKKYSTACFILQQLRAVYAAHLEGRIKINESGGNNYDIAVNLQGNLTRANSLPVWAYLLAFSRQKTPNSLLESLIHVDDLESTFEAPEHFMPALAFCEMFIMEAEAYSLFNFFYIVFFKRSLRLQLQIFNVIAPQLGLKGLDY